MRDTLVSESSGVLLFFLLLRVIALGRRYSVVLLVLRFIYHQGETEGGVQGRRLLHTRVESASYVRKGVRKLQCINLNLLEAILMVDRKVSIVRTLL